MEKVTFYRLAQYCQYAKGENDDAGEAVDPAEVDGLEPLAQQGGGAAEDEPPGGGAGKNAEDEENGRFCLNFLRA